MNEFQKERHQIFESKKLSEERKCKVIEAVHASAKRKKQWVPAIAVTCALGIGSFLLFAPELKPIDISEMSQEFTTTSLAEVFEREFQVENMEPLFGQIPFLTNNDSYIIVKGLIDGEIFYRFIYGKFEQDKWSIKEQAMLFDNYQVAWETITIENQPFKIGIIDGEDKKIFVGSEQAGRVRAREGVYIWWAKAKSLYTPVYQQVNGKLHRMANYYTTNAASSVPFIEPIGEKQSITYKQDSMTRENDEYRKFPIVIDPYYYAENHYRVGEVIAYEKEGQLELTRILSVTDPIRLIDDSFVYEVDDMQVPDFFYYWPTYDGNTGLYKNLNETYTALNTDEVFVSPDNWSSNGFRGVIKKEQIIGKVLGYDLNGVTNTMTQTDMNRYKAVKELVLDMKENDNRENSLKDFLKDVSPQKVAQLYFYASYMEDTKTMYALLTQQKDVLPPYEEWVQHQSTPTKSMRQHQLVKLYYTNQATMNEQTNRLECRDSFSKELLFHIPMQKEDGIWKVVYSTISDNSK